MLSKEKIVQALGTFFHNLVLVSTANTLVALFFIKGLDNLQNPFFTLVVITIASTLFITTMNLISKTVKEQNSSRS